MCGEDAMRVLVLGVGLAVVSGTTAAQENPPLGGYRATTQVNVVNVEVMVADRDGKLIAGLTPADFEVLEDGQARVITNFTAGFSPGGVAGAVPADEPAGAVEEATSEMLSVVVFVDNANLQPAQRDEVLREVRALLESGWPGAEMPVMLVAGNRSVRVQQPLTTNRQLLLDGLDRLTREAAGGGTSGMTSFMDQIMETSSGSSDLAAEDRRSQLDAARSAAQQAYERSRAYLAAQTQFLDSLAGIPGRKVVLYVGEGLQTRPGEAILQRFEAKYGNTVEAGFSAASEASRFSLSAELRTLNQRANASRVTFLCVQSNVRGGVSSGAEQRNMERDATIGSAEAMNQQQTLGSMAQATGGWVIPRNDQLGSGIAKVVDDMRGAYLLGYASSRPGDGTYHTLKVRVKRDGVVVRHREGYLNKTPDDRMAERPLAAVLVGAPANPLDVTVSLRSVTPDKGDLLSATVLAVIPLGNVLLQPKGDVHVGQLSLWVAVRNEQGGTIAGSKQVFPLKVPNDRLLSAQGQSVGYTFLFKLPKGPYRVAVAVRDDLGQVESTAVADLLLGDGGVAEPERPS